MRFFIVSRAAATSPYFRLDAEIFHMGTLITFELTFAHSHSHSHTHIYKLFLTCHHYSRPPKSLQVSSVALDVFTMTKVIKKIIIFFEENLFYD